ncbi:Flp family type IVb pilin [Lichenibacterium dinghuense]|uniref:Flp family type IVb pilin n=1 Tax=Lichenibacterium dinghuense TaxID=2895977 RepID=UPI001F3F5E66|nr:Flp family type IVb pilin [Lichenibacterium sp. 6Y81]
MMIRFWRDRRATTAIEYCLVAGIVSLAVVAGATAIGTRLATNYYGKIAANLS